MIIIFVSVKIDGNVKNAFNYIIMFLNNIVNLKSDVFRKKIFQLTLNWYQVKKLASNTIKTNPIYFLKIGKIHVYRDRSSIWRAKTGSKFHPI